jgi:16S rRNA C967 or C1407 C5-methylase (RsmB/RsmF family)
LLQKGNKKDECLTILDLCAAPGSKLLQLLDQLNADAAQQQHDNGSVMLVANDSNRSRLLTVACRSRLSPQRSCLILNASDGRYFPALRKRGGYKFKFDRVLADVPCSGDGTLRKLSSKEWSQWSTKTHLQLHKLQLRLLLRALELVKKGGRVVYSTCSLDPIENEAVVASAIARLGGPSVYHIVPPPKYLDPEATKPFEYSPGATHWMVPHPNYKEDHPIVYKSMDEVPKALHKKDIRPTMFPVSTRKESSWTFDGEHQEANEEEALKNLKLYGDVLSDKDALALEAMLPNCCRILPQHLDSGGFFCAILERAIAVYYAVCCPLQRHKESPDSDHHGRIYHPVGSVREMRAALATEKAANGEEVYFEGVATLELAQRWLQKHGAYVKGRSEEPIALPDPPIVRPTDDEASSTTPVKDVCTKRVQKTWAKKPIYTPLFPSPHPDLVAEFCDFFGLCQTEQEAKTAGVERFPVDQIVLLGGGENATQVTTCLDPDQAHVEDANGGRKRRFLQLTLVSEEVRSIFAGGAKFTPIEAGLALCWVAVPGLYRTVAKQWSETESYADDVDDAEVVISNKPEDTSSRAEKSGRYGLMDEGAECIGSFATQRLLALSKTECIELLETSTLELDGEKRESIPNDLLSSTWWGKWGKHHNMQNLSSSSSGAVIAICCASSTNQDDSMATIFLSCVLKFAEKQSLPRLELLTKQRLADSWLRLLQSKR